MIIGLAGKSGAGKDAVAKMLLKNGYSVYHMASPLKNMASSLGFTHTELHGSQEQKLQKNKLWDVSSREFLQKFGTELMRDQLPLLVPSMTTIWSKIFENNYLINPRPVVIADIRFEDEVGVIKKLGGVLIEIRRPVDQLDANDSVSNFSDCKFTYAHREHSSEKESEKFIYDDFIINDGSLEKLEKEADRIYKKYGT